MLKRLVAIAATVSLTACATTSDPDGKAHLYARADVGGRQHVQDQQDCRDSYAGVNLASGASAAAGALGAEAALAVGLVSNLVQGAVNLSARASHDRRCMAERGYQRVAVTEAQLAAYKAAPDKAAWLETNLPDHVGEGAPAELAAPSGRNIIVGRF